MRYYRYIPKVLALSTGLFLLAGCRNEVSAAESAGKHAESVSIAAVAAASSIDEPAFSLSLSKSGSYSAGNSGTLMLELKANRNTLAKGVIIEAKLDRGRGPVATVLIQRRTLKVGECFANAVVSP